MQGTTEFPYQIMGAFRPQADAVFDNTTALPTAVDMRDAPSAVVQDLVGPLLGQRHHLAAGFLGRHEDRHLGEREGQEAQSLQQSTPRGQGIGGRFGDAVIMGAAASMPSRGARASRVRRGVNKAGSRT